MSKIKNGGLHHYGTEPFEQQQFGTAIALKGLKNLRCFWGPWILDPTLNIEYLVRYSKPSKTVLQAADRLRRMCFSKTSQRPVWVARYIPEPSSSVYVWNIQQGALFTVAQLQCCGIYNLLCCCCLNDKRPEFTWQYRVPNKMFITYKPNSVLGKFDCSCFVSLLWHSFALLLSNEVHFTSIVS